MESYGALLKKAREEKAIDFETIARETSITQEYLEALEELRRRSPVTAPA